MHHVWLFWEEKGQGEVSRLDGWTEILIAKIL